MRKSQKFYLFWKRAIDLFGSILAIILLALPFLTIAIIIKCDSKGPVFFRQERVGKNKKLFRIFKFRTMKTNAPKNVPTHMLENPDLYMTKFERFLRRTSVDEMPQIFNVFLGQMAFIGPRPALYNQDDLIAERDKYHANDIRPGISGLAQVSGRDELPIPVKARYDGEYYEKMSFPLDVKLFFKTIFKVTKEEGIEEGKQDKPAKKD